MASIIIEGVADRWAHVALQHQQIFAAEELELLRQNISIMQEDIRLQYRDILDQSHYGRPSVVTWVQSEGRGRPRAVIDPDFLRWAYSLRSTSSIARFLNLGRKTIRNALLEYGIAAPQENPFAAFLAEDAGVDDDHDTLLDPVNPTILTGASSSADGAEQGSSTVSFTGPLSVISDTDLDVLISHLRGFYTRAGITILGGMLLRLGLRIPRERVRQSLIRIDPVQRIFERIRIRRRKYSVPGPNALWHHDGQHGRPLAYIGLHLSKLIDL